MPLKRFDLPDPPALPDEPVEFELAGKHRFSDERFVEKFAVVDVVPFTCIDDMAFSIEPLDDGSVNYAKHAVMRFMHRVIVPDDRQRWYDLLNDADRLVEIKDIIQVMLWIVGETTDRPTGPRSNSHNGSAETSDGSAVDSLSTGGDAPS